MYFFTDIDKINRQVRYQQFGPVAGEENYTFSVTNKFSLASGAKAYAILDGDVLVQPVGNSTNTARVNVAIRVTENTRSGYTGIDYVIYRNISLYSLLKSQTEVADKAAAGAPEQNDLIDLLWDNWQASVANTSTLPDPAKRDTSAAPVIDSLGLKLVAVNDATKLDFIFGNENNAFQLAHIKAGQSIGLFDETQDAGIELILAEPLFTPTLGTLWADYGQIAILPQDATTVHNQSFKVKKKREEVLAFLDISLFYALSAEIGIGYKEAGSDKQVKGRQAVYDKLLTYCAGRNSVFLDLRNETSHGLDYYGEYSDPSSGTYAQFQLGTNGTSPTLFAPDWAWPLFSLKPLPTAVAATTLQFKIKQQHNTDPLVYLEFGQLPTLTSQTSGKQAKFFSLSNPGQAWSTGFTVETPTVLDNGQPVALAWATKLMVLRRSVENYGNSGVPDTAPLRQNYLDNIFGPITPLPGIALGGKGVSYTAYGKRWLTTSDAGNNTILGAIVAPFRQHTDSEVFFGATVVDQYVSTSPAPFAAGLPTAENKWEGDTARFARRGFNTFSSEPIIHAWAKAELQSAVERVAVTTPTLTDAQILTAATTTDAVSLYMTRAEYNGLLGVANLSFDEEIQDCYIYFSPFSTQLIANGPLVYSSVLRLGGVVSARTYYTIPYQPDNLMPLIVPVLSLDGLRFNTQNIGQAAKVTTEALASTAPFYHTQQLTADLQVLEQLYATRDVRIDQQVTRLRVHYYGFNYDTLPPNYQGLGTALAPAVIHGIQKRDYHTLVDEAKSVVMHLAKDNGTGKGYIFNLNVDESDYWEKDPTYTGLPGDDCTPNIYGKVPPSFRDSNACNVRQVYINELPQNNIAGKSLYTRLTSGGKLLLDPAGLSLDWGHSLYTFDALFTGPVIPFRSSVPTTTTGFNDLGIDSPVDLANYMGDITGTLAVAYNRYNSLSKEYRQANTIRPLLDWVYDDTSTLTDIIGDADGFGLYSTWKNAFAQNPQAKLSDVIAHYYNPVAAQGTSPYTYLHRWKIFCEEQHFIVIGVTGDYVWRPSLDNLRQRMDACYKFGYLAEAQSLLLAEYLAGWSHFVGIKNKYKRQLLNLVAPLDAADRDYVLDKFLSQIKGLLNQEQNWNL